MGTRTRGSRSSRDSRKHRGVWAKVQNELLPRGSARRGGARVTGERGRAGSPAGRTVGPAGALAGGGGCLDSAPRVQAADRGNREMKGPGGQLAAAATCRAAASTAESEGASGATSSGSCFSKSQANTRDGS